MHTIRMIVFVYIIKFMTPDKVIVAFETFTALLIAYMVYMTSYGRKDTRHKLLLTPQHFHQYLWINKKMVTPSRSRQLSIYEIGLSFDS